ARSAPVDLGMVADLRLAIADIIDAVRSIAPEAKIKEIAAERHARTAAYTEEMREFRRKIVQENADRSPVSLERIGLELEAALDKDTCFVGDIDSGRVMETAMSFGVDGKQYLGTGSTVLGYGMHVSF